MGEFVGDNRLQLQLVQLLEKATGDGDGGMLRIAAGGQRVW